MSVPRDTLTDSDYTRCIITPMTEDEEGRPIIRLVHVVDALIVGAVVFFSLLLGSSLPAILLGESAYITTEELQRRVLTALIGSAMTFFAQWARYRGLQLMRGFNGD